MASSDSPTPQRACEVVLLEAKRYNIEHDCAFSEVVVADRLLARSLELAEAYEELHCKLYAHPPALKVFLDLVLSTAAYWSPEQITAQRAARTELEEVNRLLAKQAAEVAELLRRRAELHNTSGFCSDTAYHVCDVIALAAKENSRFVSYVQPRVESLKTQFDLKYWPALSEFLQALSSDAERASLEATDPLTKAATRASRRGLADFCEALLAAIEENRRRMFGPIPEGFGITDKTFAALTSCALGLGPDELIDADYVKRLRQRRRERVK